MNMTQIMAAGLAWIQLVEAAFSHQGANRVALEPAVRSFWLMHGIDRMAVNQNQAEF